MKVHRLVVTVIDFEDYGASSIGKQLMNVRDMHLSVQSMDTADIGEWTDANPLNNSKTRDAEIDRLFPQAAQPAQMPADNPCLNDYVDKTIRAHMAKLEASGWRLVPVEFLQGFGTLAHNYSLRAVPPDYYSGTDGDAFSNAYARCGQDLAKLKAMLAVTSAEHTSQKEES